MQLKYSRSNLEKLEQLFKELEYVIRYEKGTFNSGYCIVEDKKIIIINRFFDTEGRINVLLDILSNILIMEDRLSKGSLQFFKNILKVQESETI
ncbi:MAG TPA: hypothetical protein PKD85_08290 [Saprospiraceae bacterium]|nr:hypothetical protein [Saprospiraceae bacterium]